MDQVDVVRRSIARISFKWRNNHSLDKRTVGTVMDMVIPGVIISVKNGECLIIVDPCFFRAKHRLAFQVKLPEPGGNYGKNIEVKSHNRIHHEEFCGFVVKSNDYVQPVTFETSPIEQRGLVFAFSFTREVVTSVSYSAGHIVDSSQSNQLGLLFHDSALHEYGFLGSPILNQKGHVVGICYATQTRIHAWTTHFLKKEFDCTFINDWSSRIRYVCSNKDSSQEGGSSSENRNQQGDPNQQGDVPQHVAESSRTEGVVTLAYTSDLASRTTYFPGIIVTCEQGQGKAHTTFVFSSHIPDFDEVYVYFQPHEKVEAKIRSNDSGFMIVSVEDEEYHEPLTWSSSGVLPDYELVSTVCIMAGTKLNAEVNAPLQPLTGYLGVYSGQITTPRCNAATASSCTILSGTENYFQFSCSFQDDFITLKNMDLDKDVYKSDSAVPAPVFSLKGEFLGILVSSGNWPDLKTGLYSQPVLSKIEHLMNEVPGQKGWSKAKLKWSG